MKKITSYSLIALLSLMLGTLSFTSYAAEKSEDSYTQTVKRMLQQRPEFSMLDIEGNIRTNTEWDGKVVVLNFWATWCPPCVREIPMFTKVQKEFADKGLQFVGVAVDDPQAVERFMKRVEINYPILVNDVDGITLAKKFGNHIGALPFTAIINRAGDVVFKRPGELHEMQLKRIVMPLLKEKVPVKEEKEKAI